ncbi:hypothetical protein BDZ89DRAFT_1064623 [Hymenopellis radicata]|nr:hypothetical protein BDZ89DRAFT_1064623 [Hymenopellis radicata]
MESNCLLCGARPRRSVYLEDETPFHHLAVCNFPPRDAELSDIGATILPVVERDIATLSTTIDAARLVLQSLEQERDALYTVQQSYRNIISTRRRIPQEIWSEIFLYAHSLNDDCPDWYLNRVWPFRTIWQLSQVCQTWRNLAFSLHSCWSSIALKFPLDWPAAERDVELLAFVLERSHQHLLDVTIVDRNDDGLPFTRHMREKAFAESHRWRTARLTDFHVEVSPGSLYAPLRGRLPRLELLDIDSVGRMGSDIRSAFKDCPRLVTVTLSGADLHMVELPMKQITCLRLYHNWPGDDFRACVDLIGQCSLLEILRVDSASERAQDPPLQSLTLPCLRDLSATHPYLLDSLTLPRLEVAALDRRYGNLNPDTLYSFYRLIQRSNCASNLTELRLIQVPLTLHRSDPHLLLSILSQTTKLATLQLEAVSTLRIDYDPFNDEGDSEDRRLDRWSITQIMDVMRALEVVPGHTVTFLPRLVSLDIEANGRLDVECIPYLEPHDGFVAMLKARHADNEVGLSKLEKFHFGLGAKFHGHWARLEMRICVDVFDDHEISDLRGLCEDGMDLIVQFRGTLGLSFLPTPEYGLS